MNYETYETHTIHVPNAVLACRAAACRVAVFLLVFTAGAELALPVDPAPSRVRKKAVDASR